MRSGATIALTPRTPAAPCAAVDRAAIAALAARLHAATHELLVLLHEFDQRTGWNNGCLSCAHWLHWRTGVDLGAAREKVRVATADNEASLLDLALAGNCTQVERVVRAWRRVDGVQAAQKTAARHLQRQLSTWVDDDGMVVVRGRLTPEVGAVVQRALEAAADRLFREAAHAPSGDAIVEELTPAQRRADALGFLAESGVDQAAPAAVPVSAAASDAFDGALEVDHGAVYVSMETSQRLACDASLVHMHHAPDGTVLDMSRKTRTIPPSIRRALAARDTCCRFPGCTSRRCDAHHIEHWSDGGATRLDNLVRLCRRHHRAVHEGGFGVIGGRDGVPTFLRPDGAPLEVAAASPRHLPTLHDATPHIIGTPPTWDGAPFDLPWAIDVLYRPGVPASTV